MSRVQAPTFVVVLYGCVNYQSRYLIEKLTVSDTLERLRGKAIPVVRMDTRAHAEQMVWWLAEAGIRIFEITLTTPGALDLIKALSEESGLLVGAGTVMSLTEADEVLDAGAQFVVSPRLSEPVVQSCRAAARAVICGALTPSEIAQAADFGANAVKVFPVNAVGGAAYLRSVCDVFPNIPLVPTGGIRIEDVASYFNAGAFALGVGGTLVDKKAIERGDSGAIKAAAATLVASGAT